MHFMVHCISATAILRSAIIISYSRITDMYSAKERKVVMKGSKKILQSAHTTGPPYSLFKSHFIRLKEYGVMMLKRKCFSEP